jgi:hypothetical protein
MIKATNKATGELIELPSDTPEQIVQAWTIAQEYEKAAKALKDQLKQLVPNIIGERTTSEPIGNYQFRISIVQRKNYDKSKLYELVEDQDLLSMMLKPDKTFIDSWLKENVETSAEIGTGLRASMVDEGKPYQVIKLEKLTRED